MAAEPQYYEFPSYTPTVHRKSYPAIDPTNPANSAEGKVVLITGGGIGVGKGIATAFVRAGAKAIALLGRRSNILLEAKADLEKLGSSKILTFQADVLDSAALEKAFSSTAKAIGPIDITVANAGYLASPSPALDSDIDDYWKTFEINIKGTLLTFRAFMKNKIGKEPVFISLNTAATHGGIFPTLSAYGASKMGQAHLVSYLAAENPGVRVVQFHPGVIETDMNTKSQMPLAKDDMSLPSSFAVWLASPAAAWTGGRFLWAHWDVDELAAKKDEILAESQLEMGLKGWPKVMQAVIAQD